MNIVNQLTNQYNLLCTTDRQQTQTGTYTW